MRTARADVRRRRRGGEAAEGGVHECGTGEDARVPAGGPRAIRAGGREGDMETMNQLRIVDCGLRIGKAAVKSAIRNPQSAIASLALQALAFSPARSPAQQWPVHSLDRPRPPVVDPGPERPPVAPPADEIQVLDTYHNDTYADGQAAAVYGQTPPLVNACRPPGQWQAYDIVFHRPHFAADGSVRDSARVTVFHNGVLAQDNTVITGWTVHGSRAHYQPHADKLPLVLQDHGNPVRYRDIWVRELGGSP